MKNLFRLIKDYFKAHPVVLTIVVICAFLNALAAIIAPIMLQNTVNLIEIGIKENWINMANFLKIERKCLILLVLNGLLMQMMRNGMRI